MKNLNRVVFGLSLLFPVLLPQVSAEVILEPLKGSLVITAPDGSVKLLDFGETVPDVQPNSNIEVFQGQMKISVTEGDTATWSCGGNSGSVSGGAGATISCGDSTGLLEVTEGELTYTDAQGQAHTLKAGDKAELKIIPKDTPPVAADDTEGSDPDEENDNTDSRSIEASVSQ